MGQESTFPANEYMGALGHIHSLLPDLPAWCRRLTPGQLEDIARLMAGWKNPPARATLNPSSEYSFIPKLEDVERELIHQSIRLCGGNITEAATALGIGKTTIYRKLREWGEDPRRFSKAALRVAAAVPEGVEGQSLR